MIQFLKPANLNILHGVDELFQMACVFARYASNKWRFLLLWRIGFLSFEFVAWFYRNALLNRFIFNAMATTVHDVAQKANVSVGTVSRYLNGYQLRESNRTRIERAIADLGFKGNIFARGLKRKRSMAIAVVTPDFDIFSTSITTEVEQILEQERYSLIICDYQGSKEALRRKLMFLQDRYIDGVILFPSNLAASSKDIIQKYLAKKVPIVLVDHTIPGIETDTVIIDNVNASFRAMEELIRHHHRRIAIINGRKDSFVSQERLQGYYNAMQTYGLPVQEEWLAWGEFTQAGGYHAVKTLMALPERPTAIYATNYTMTVGAVLALQERHIAIPEQISFVGFDRFESVEIIEPPLTMVEQPLNLIAQNAANLILKRIRGEYNDFATTVKLNTKMVIGHSVKHLVLP